MKPIVMLLAILGSAGMLACTPAAAPNPPSGSAGPPPAGGAAGPVGGPYAYTLGPAEAQVVLEEYADYQ